MANGHTHRFISATALAIATPFVQSHFGDPHVTGTVIVAGLFGIVVSTPDKDQSQHVSWFWKPYAKAIGHRSWKSHFPIIGTLIRLAYMVVALSVVIAALAALAVGTWYVIRTYDDYWLLAEVAIATVMAIDGIHWCLDKFPV